MSDNLTGRSIEEIYDAEKQECFIRAVRSEILAFDENELLEENQIVEYPDDDSLPF